MYYKIRKYESADLPLLAEIFRTSIRHLGGEYYSKEQIAAWSSFSEDTVSFKKWLTEASTIVAVSDNDTCIGFGSLEDKGRIASLFVAPDAMRMGVGSALLEHLIQEARARNIDKLTTEASEFSKPLFEKYSFTVKEIEQTEFKGVRFSRYAMFLHITKTI